ncbi:MAG TPA: LysR family transcriptional regulator [Hydrogenophaga sp.]|uniref:LysR substrate-binding domain-containing protein n=1 Tax=Hydrogenophaga sp. TaxID=1904254 RepID=UPI0008B0245A|nr:LysR substrate-binding domain-containing protein [Hydrogenophaga sp.]OGA79711.1 MAG: LysR family transcriptional regulator [Burkholderiales bacterium GWE1_65_30]OGA92632.1 MAG: LysR family transcriptional regulator [Burkholderiales bacterium GWF1_66_17]HAX22011.1 LysR family transcriptional regulator [Hydrogenophaga sp.]HBU21163.1 LysR family transcriptional regulator [Hydrogenophaga sp.]
MAQHSDPDQTLVRMPSLRAIRSFVAAAKYQSFTRAAEALCVTQAAISRQIRELEEHLGTELFIRTGRSVKLSADGMVFYDAAQLSFINISQAAERLRSKHRPRQTLTICCSNAFASLWLQDRLPDFFYANPEIELRLVATQDFLGMESSLRPDVFITKMAHVRSWYSSERLFHDVIYPVCSPQYLDEHPKLMNLQSLREADLLDLSPYGRSQLAEHIDWAVWLAFHGIDLGERTHTGRPLFSSNDYNLLVQLALQHQGVALGWDHLVSHLVADGQLVRPIPQEVVHSERCHFLNIRADNENSEACTRFRDWILNQFPDRSH